MCNCPGATPQFVLQRNTVWDDVSIAFPYELSGYDEIKISFKNLTTGTILKSISSTDSPAGSYIDVDTDENKIFPIITAEDSTDFAINTMYVFDVAMITNDEVLRRSGICELTAIDTITAA